MFDITTSPPNFVNGGNDNGDDNSDARDGGGRGDDGQLTRTPFCSW